VSTDDYRIFPRGEERSVEGCAHCGIDKREHGQRWIVAVGWHKHVAPDAALLRRRMWYRRTVRRLARALRGAS